MVRSLLLPYRKFVRETEQLTQVLVTTGGFPAYGRLEREKERLIAEMCVMRLHDAWARFCRELVVTSAYAEPLTANGKKVHRIPGITHRSQVISALLSTYKKRRSEPSWYLARECIDASSRLQVANHRTISAGIGLSFPNLSISPNDQVRFIRNLFAHRGQDTAAEATRVEGGFSFPVGGNLSALPTTLTAPGITVFAFWVNCLRLMAHQSIQ